MSALQTPEVFVRIDPAIAYGTCPECGAEEGQQCSTEWGTEQAGWVHALRQHGGVGSKLPSGKVEDSP